MKNIKDKFIGKNEKAQEGDIIEMEVDLRYSRNEMRTLKYFVNEREQKLFLTNLPSSVQFAVFY